MAHRIARRRGLLFAGSWVALLALTFALSSLGVLDPAERAGDDAHFSVRGSRPAPRDVVVVHIDARTLQTLRQRFPFPRAVHAGVIDALHRAGARVIAYDVQFSEPTDARDDNALIDAITRAGNVVLATTETDAQGNPNVLGGGDILARIGARAGNANFSVDPGAVIRRLPFQVDGLRHFALVAAERALHRQFDPAEFSDQPWIDYAGPPGTVYGVSFSDVLAGRVPASRLAGKVLVVGASAPSLQDLHATSTGSLMSGAEIQANAVDTALHGFPLRSAPGWTDPLVAVVLSLLPLAASLRRGALWGLTAALVGAVAYAVITQVSFDHGTVLPLATPMLALALTAVVTLMLWYVAASYERERVRDLFARFVPERVVDEALARADGLRLGGELIEGTILFSDVRGFTAYSETRPAGQVIEVLNRYLTTMSDAILDHGGTLTAYMGDGIMALFGGPLDQLDHADRALAAARAMLERLEEFNDWVRANGLSEGFRIGIGLNTGTVMAGNVGSERRLEYTAIGDAVNTAARIEGLTKGTPHQLFLSDTTRGALRDRSLELDEIGDLPVRGRRGTVKVWAVAGSDVQAAGAARSDNGPDEA
ncbi:MAG TPA: adenylate/guanylate cyclase domain-containing protein [Solirubrobacteraceae bacterium]|nr:adenylate/guanylate cyclase domain-containing protein [Solirubrobacteraceae bacterium]